MTERGFSPASSDLVHEVIPCPDNIATLLSVTPQEPVIFLLRLRYVEGNPIALVSSYLLLQICPHLEHMDLTNRSLYEFLESNYGITITRAQRILKATSSDESQAKLLKIEPGAPVIKLESISYLEVWNPGRVFCCLPPR